MANYLLSRLYSSLVTIFLVSVAVFLIGYISGDPVALIAPRDATPEDIEIIRDALGLNRPFPVQYWEFISKAIRGDFGTSLWQRRSALGLILEQFPATLELTAAAMAISVVVSIPLGIVSAIKKDGIIDRLSMVLAVFLQSIPNFWLGIMMIFLFSVELGWLPSTGRGTWKHLIMPAISLAAFPTARLARLTRSGMLDVLGQDYIETARAKGLRESAVIIGHALRNAAVSLVTTMGMQIGTLIGGAVIIEAIFAWPGVGYLVTQAIYARDFPLVRGAVLFLAIVLAFLNLLVDLVYGLVDPRITYR